MKFIDLARTRYSVRSYAARPVAEDDLNTILEAARLAPSANNAQPWYFIVVRGEDARRAVARAYPRDWFRSAPVIIVVCSEPSAAWVRRDGKNYSEVDAAIAMDHITLCAADLGLGTCWIAAFDPVTLSEALGLPAHVSPVVMTPLGYPTDSPPARKSRKPLPEIVHYERWS